MRRVAEGNLDASLVTDDGSQVKPIRVDMSEKMTHTFDLIFPRMKDGVPLIKEGQKQFSVQFQSPQILYFVGINIASRRVRVDFDLSKMLVGGKLNY
jgi:hypothetical protein